MLEIKRKELMSVGIDIGTTTSHLVFSRLMLQNDPFAKSSKFNVTERNIVYRGKIYLTPLKPGNREIDIDALLPLMMAEYDKAGISIQEVDTGAVIITGEIAKKENADLIVEKLSSEGGRFIAATAGPNYEAMISAYGSGAVEYSHKNNIKLIHSDTGGGTSNIAIIDSGKIIATACINIGGRLLAYDDDLKLTRIENAGNYLLKEIGSSKEVGQRISRKEINKICRVMASTLIDVLTGVPETRIIRELMLTDALPPYELRGDVYHSFSGGVAEYIYGYETQSYGDLGKDLGIHLRRIINEQGIRLVNLPERIRATVIGASSYTLELSGATTYSSTGFKLPIRNVPVTSVDVDKTQLSADYVQRKVSQALKKIDMEDKASPIALAFKDPVTRSVNNIRVFTSGLSRALYVRIGAGVPIVLIFESDFGNSVGNVFTRETGAKNILALDEISLKEGDFIDVGEPMYDGLAYPVIIKSLVF